MCYTSQLSHALKVLGTAGGLLLNTSGGILAQNASGEEKRLE